MTDDLFPFRVHQLKLDLINLTGLQEDLGQIVLSVQVTPQSDCDNREEVGYIYIYIYNSVIF